MPDLALSSAPGNVAPSIALLGRRKRARLVVAAPQAPAQRLTAGPEAFRSPESIRPQASRPGPLADSVRWALISGRRIEGANHESRDGARQCIRRH
jgi:hypothetical protein